MRVMVAVLGGVCLVGCERKAKEPRYEGPMPVTFGDCAGTDIAWASGPRPAPFTAEQAAPVWIEDRAAGADTTKTASNAPPDAPPGPDVTDEPASASNDSKHAGKQETADDARKQALEQARAAGILGSTTSGGAFASLTGTGDIGEIDEAGLASLLGPPGDSIGEGNGGFGLKDAGLGLGGFGPGGGGTGWGTIGTGKYGTIGHGSGTGTSYGIGRHPSNAPRVSIAAPLATGNLDKNIIRRYIRRNINKITFCYEKQLLAKPSIQGEIDTEFFISPDGDVASSQAKGFDTEVASCVAAVIKDIDFPKPQGGGGVLVKYPFQFRPADGGASGSGSAVGSGSGSDAAGSDAGSAAGSGSAAPVAPGPHSSRRLYRVTGPVDRTYLPGTANPLRVEQAGFEECFRTGARHYGTAVVELAYDESGKTTNATVHGIDEERVKTCVAKVAKRVKRSGTDGAGQRCSIAFGQMPSSDLPALDIGADAVALGGKKVATMDAVVKDDVIDNKIPGLYDAIVERVRAAGAVQAVVSAYGPLVVRPLPTAKMKGVARVLRAIVAAGDDFVLASQKGAEWQLVEPLALPIVPVPFGTGAVWNHVKVTSSAFGDDKTPVISVLVTPAKITIFQTGHEKLELPRTQLDKVSDELRVRKSSGAFLERPDIEIATSDDATYDDFLAVVQVAVVAGFRDWQLTSPSALLGER